MNTASHPPCPNARAAALAVAAGWVFAAAAPAGGEGGRGGVGLRPDQASALAVRGFSPDADGALGMLRSLVPRPQDAAEVQRLVDELDSDSFAEREAAERSIAAFGERARVVLEDALAETGSSEIRLRLRRLLRSTGEAGAERAIAGSFRILDAARPEAATSTLLEALPYLRSSWNRREASRLLGEWARPADFQALIESAGDGDVPVAARAALAPALGKTHGDDPRHLAAIERLFAADQPPVLRLAAARVFAEQGRRSALAAVVDLLGQPDEAVARGAGHLLARWVEGGPPPPIGDPVAARAWLGQHGDSVPLAHPLPRFDDGPIVGYATADGASGVARFDLDGVPVSPLLECSPYDVEPLRDGGVMVCARGAGAVEIFDRDGERVRSVRDVGRPTDAELLPDGRLLVLDNGGGQAIEVDEAGEVVWRVGGLENPYDVDRLPDGNTLVADSGNGRLVEFDPIGEVVWEVAGLDFPNSVHRLPGGDTLYTTYTSGGLVLIDADGRQRFARQFDGATLYSIATAAGEIHVSDGRNGCVYRLDLDGGLVAVTPLPAGFSDVGFVRE